MTNLNGIIDRRSVLIMIISRALKNNLWVPIIMRRIPAYVNTVFILQLLPGPTHIFRYIASHLASIYCLSRTLCNIEYSSETHLKLKSREISFVHNMSRLSNRFEICPIVPNTAVILPCSVQNFKTIGSLTRMLWGNEFSGDLSLRWVSDACPILHITPDFEILPSSTHTPWCLSCEF